MRQLKTMAMLGIAVAMMLALAGPIEAATRYKAPTGVRVHTLSVPNTLLVWNKAKGAQRYRVAISTKKNMRNAVRYITKGSAPKKWVNKLKPGKRYYVKVRSLSKKAKGRSAYSKKFSFVAQYRTGSAAGSGSSGIKRTTANTGVPAGTRLTRHDGNIVVTQPGTHLDGLDIYGFVEIKAANVTISNSIVRGSQATSNRGIVMNLGSPGFVIRDSTITPRFPSVRLDGIIGRNFVAQRVFIDGGVDSVKITGSNVRIIDSLLQNTDYYASDPNQGGGPTHNDNIQMLGGSDVTILGNTIRGAQTHTVLAQAAHSEGRVLIANNWLDGAICNVKLQRQNGYALAATVTGNKFGPNRRWQKCKISAQSGGGVSVSQSGNSMEIGGGAVGLMWE